MNKNFYYNRERATSAMGRNPDAYGIQNPQYIGQAQQPTFFREHEQYLRPYGMYASTATVDPFSVNDLPYGYEVVSEAMAKREMELEMREMRFLARQLLVQNRLPAELADIIRTDSEKAVINAVQLLVKFRDGSDSKYPLDKLRILDEKKLPEAESDPGQVSDLRRAFGLM